MLIGGVWVLGPGDSSPEIRKIKAFMRAKFASYAGHLADTDLYDGALGDPVNAKTMVGAVKEMQRRYGLPTSGVIGYSLKVKMGYLKIEPPVLHTIEGFMSDMWFGPAAECGRVLEREQRVRWRPVYYDSRSFPLNRGRDAARTELIRRINDHPGPFGIACYSLGADAASLVLKYDLVPGGVLAHRQHDLKRAVAFGNPRREVGVVRPGQGSPPPHNTGGISGDRIINTPSWWWEFVHDNDLYSDNDPTTQAGENKTSIYNLIMADPFGGPDSLIAQIWETIANPAPGLWGLFSAIYDGIKFASNQGPHMFGAADVGAAINHLRSISA
jgi:hypothetical protein